MSKLSVNVRAGGSQTYMQAKEAVITLTGSHGQAKITATLQEDGQIVVALERSAK